MDFTPKQKYSLLNKMGYTGSLQEDEMEAFIRSQPGISARMGKFNNALKRGFAEGGAAFDYAALLEMFKKDPTATSFATESASATDTSASTATADAEKAARSTATTTTSAPAETTASTTSTPTSTTSTSSGSGGGGGSSRSKKDKVLQAYQDAGLDPDAAGVEFWTQNYNPETFAADFAQGAKSAEQKKIDYGEKTKADKVAYEGRKREINSEITDLEGWLETATDPAEREEIQSRITGLKAELTGMVDPAEWVGQDLGMLAGANPEAIVKKQDVADAQAASVSGTAGQVSGADPQATTSTAEETTARDPDSITTSRFDAATDAQAKIDQAAAEADAATSEVGSQATVQGQLAELMADFEDGTPPWASGAMRAATARMQQRGLNASSMAGEAITLAAMQAALPIAQQDAQTYAQREMANLSNEQQMQILKTQTRFQGILSDQAAENASLQFNAASENQTKQFMSSLETQVAQFNAAQINGIRQYNAGQKNAVEQFNTQIKDARDKFNAQNSLVIAQANAQLRQQTNLANTAAKNEANRQYAANVNALTAASLDNYWQTERDEMAYAFQESENAADRNVRLLLGQGQLDAQGDALDAQKSAAIGGLAFKAVSGLTDGFSDFGF